jgi:hypothetical protein
MASPDTDLLAALDTDLATLTAGTNAFSGPVRPVGGGVPQKAVFIYCTPGGEIMNYCNDGTRTPMLYSASCRVVVRGDKDDYSGARTLARSIRDAAHFRVTTGYIAVRVRTAEPEYYGTDDIGAHLFGMDIDMLYSA